MSEPVNYSYFKRERMEWIGETLRIFGFINRYHIERKFWISPQQASADIKQFMEMHPTLMSYDRSKKSFVAAAQPKELDDGT